MSILGTRSPDRDPASSPREPSTPTTFQDVAGRPVLATCIVRSTVAHARMNVITTSAAKNADGVVAPVHRRDLAEAGVGPARPMMRT